MTLMNFIFFFSKGESSAHFKGLALAGEPKNK